VDYGDRHGSPEPLLPLRGFDFWDATDYEIGETLWANFGAGRTEANF